MDLVLDVCMAYLKISACGVNTRTLNWFDVVADDVGFSDNGRMKVGFFRWHDRMRFGEWKETIVCSITKRLDCVSYTDTQQREGTSETILNTELRS